MKKTAKLFVLALALVLLVGLFSACSTRLSGVYTSTDGKSYEFDGKNFTYTLPGEKKTVIKGTYEIVEIDEDEYIYLTALTTQVGEYEAKEYTGKDLNGENALSFIMRKPGDKDKNGQDLGIETAYIKIENINYYLVQ